VGTLPAQLRPVATSTRSKPGAAAASTGAESEAREARGLQAFKTLDCPLLWRVGSKTCGRQGVAMLSPKTYRREARFEYRFESKTVAQRHPHYGRFLHLVPNQPVQLTWVTGAGGTAGAETAVTVELEPKNGCTRLRLTHAGIATEVACDGHKRAWPSVLEHLEKQLDRSSSKPAVAGDANGKIYTVFGSGTTGTQ
jgi:Activator of Hsp90 ATPase homolog 1-like protein